MARSIAAKRLLRCAHFKICKSTAIDYLRRCLRFEKEALSLVHVLGGCGNRATGEFESLYFRNTGTAMASSLTLVGDSSGMGEWLHIQGTSWKSSLLRGVNVAKSTLVPRKKMRALRAYWQIVRPFACGLLKGLRFLASQGALSIKHADAVKHFGELSIWQSRCFVRATGGAVRAWVSKALRRIGCAISHLAHFRPRSAKMIVRSCPLILTLAANASTRLLLLLTVLTDMPTLLRVVQARTTSSSL